MVWFDVQCPNDNVDSQKKNIFIIGNRLAYKDG